MVRNIGMSGLVQWNFSTIVSAVTSAKKTALFLRILLFSKNVVTCHTKMVLLVKMLLLVKDACVALR